MNMQTYPTPLLDELRALIAGADKPITMIALPRWAALHAARQRARETDGKIIQAYADALRYIPNKRQNNGSCVLWLPIADHVNGGVHLFFNPGYEAGLLTAFSYRTPILWPRKWSEKHEDAFGGPLMAWRSDQHLWWNNPPVAEVETRRMAAECVRLSRKSPAYINPSPFLLEVIMRHEQGLTQEEPV